MCFPQATRLSLAHLRVFEHTSVHNKLIPVASRCEHQSEAPNTVGRLSHRQTKRFCAAKVAGYRNRTGHGGFEEQFHAAHDMARRNRETLKGLNARHTQEDLSTLNDGSGVL
jgi:hypothetical protein